MIFRIACCVGIGLSCSLNCDVLEAQEKKFNTNVIVITDTATNKRTESLKINHNDVGLAQSGPNWSVEKTTLHGGKQEGCELVTINNGKLKIIVVPTRGMSVFQVTDGDMVLGWNSPVKEIVHPQYINLHTRGGLGWLEGFSEWLVRCGLESAGHPGNDEFVNNVGDKVEMDLTLHGKVGNIPASKVMVSVDSQPPHRIRVQGIVNERMFYGPKLELTTEISTVPGESTFRITDKLVNHGAEDQEFQLIYHANYGAPLLGKGAKALVAAEKVEPMNEHAAKSIKSYATYEAPTKGFIEQVYLVYPKSDASGRATALLKNVTGDRGTSITWRTAELPYITIWKNTAAEADGYVTGLEPATGFPFNRGVERKFGRVPKLAAGESRTFELEFGLHTGSANVSKVEAAIAKRQGNRPPELATEPPAIPE